MKRLITLLMIIIVSLFIFYNFYYFQYAPKKNRFATNSISPQIISNSGASALFPENTLLSFQNAIKSGADIILTDVRITLDGHFVTLASMNLGDTTEGRGLVSETNLANIKKLNAGYHFTRDGKNFPFRSQPATIPLLKQVLESFAETDFWFELHLENAVSLKKFLAFLREHDNNRRFVLSTDKPEFRDIIKSEAPWTYLAANITKEKKYIFLFHIRFLKIFPPAEDIFFIGKDDAVNLKLMLYLQEMGYLAWGWPPLFRRGGMEKEPLPFDGLITENPGLIKKLYVRPRGLEPRAF